MIKNNKYLLYFRVNKSIHSKLWSGRVWPKGNLCHLEYLFQSVPICSMSSQGLFSSSWCVFTSSLCAGPEARVHGSLGSFFVNHLLHYLESKSVRHSWTNDCNIETLKHSFSPILSQRSTDLSQGSKRGDSGMKKPPTVSLGAKLETGCTGCTGWCHSSVIPAPNTAQCTERVGSVSSGCAVFSPRDTAPASPGSSMPTYQSWRSFWQSRATECYRSCISLANILKILCGKHDEFKYVQASTTNNHWHLQVDNDPQLQIRGLINSWRETRTKHERSLSKKVIRQEMKHPTTTFLSKLQSIMELTNAVSQCYISI